MAKIMQNTNYHRVLRVAVVVCALILVFESGLLSQSTAIISDNTENYLASAIGMSASVQPTELNQLTADITSRQKELDEREAMLREREIAIGLVGGDSSDNSTYILAGILFILLVLILLNYVLDYLHLREREIVKTV